MNTETGRVKIDPDIDKAKQLAEKIIRNVEKVMVGKTDAVRLAVIALISQGHLLIEDAPGRRQDHARPQPGKID